MYFVKGKESKEGSSPLTLDAAVQQRIDDVAEAWTAPFLRARAVERSGVGKLDQGKGE
jgi:hypothetical protein